MNTGRFMSGLHGMFGGNPQQDRQDPNLDDDEGQENQGGVGDGYDMHDPNAPDPLAEALKGIYGGDESEEDEDPDPNAPTEETGPDGKPLPPLNQRLAQQIQTLINGISVPEDMVPADFNASDPKQLRDLLAKSQQSAALTTVQAVMAPMQVAMESWTNDIKKFVGEAIRDSNQGNQRASALEQAVPEIKNDTYRPMIQGMYDQALKKKDATPQSAAAAVRAAIDVIGIKTADSPNGHRQQRQDPHSGGFRTGNSALDAFAPLSRPKPAPKRPA